MGEDDEDLFERAMQGVAPLARPREVVRRPPPRGKSPVAKTPRAPVRFEVERIGERVEGLAAGVDRKLLRRLERGEVEVDRELDLHGLNEAGASEVVAGAVALALQVGYRCLRIVHGRGLRSPEGPTLKEAVVRWLAEPPLGRHVLAFASAPPRQGGPGATLVLLRQERKADPGRG